MNTEEKENILETLKEMTYNKSISLIKDKLNSIDNTIKGKIFEEYLAFLFEGNGFIATVNGGSWDGGADILLSRKDNPNKVVWIVQAKNTLKPLGNTQIKEELIKFEKESRDRYKCKYFMIISINGYVEKINIYNMTNMSLENYNYIEELINNFSDTSDDVQVVLPDLRPHNRYTYKEIKAILDNKNKVAVPNATGTGKSFIILQLLFDYMKKDTIVLAPTNEIIYRLKTMAPWSITKCKFYTYSKFSAMHTKGKLENLKVDLIILDELHRAGALNWGKAVKHILAENTKAKVVGLSATPIRFLDNNRDMIDELMDGVSTTPLSLSDAIARRILPSPTYVSAMYNLDKEIEKKLKLMKKYNLSAEDKRKYIEELYIYKSLLQNESRIENIIKKHLPKKKNLKFIVFCESNKHLNSMKDEVITWFKNVIPQDFNIKEYVVTSDTNNNSQQLNNFENINLDKEVKLLFAISKLNEGIHIKNISGIIMLRNTKSPSIYYQQLGRCLTAESTDENPIVFDFVDNIDNLELINFRAKLEEASFMINSYRRGIGLEDDNIRIALYEEHQDLILKLRNIEKKITYNWEKSFQYLKEYRELYGNLNVPKTQEYSRLYSWISLQRTLYNKQILSPEFISRLESIGFIWDVRFNNWQNNLKEYIDYNRSCYNKKISHYKIISREYYLPVYEADEETNKNNLIIKWMDKQIKEYINGDFDVKRQEIFKQYLKENLSLIEGEWIESIYNIMNFYKYIKEKFNIDCYINRISPDKKNFINLLSSLYSKGGIITATVEKSLPKSGQVINSLYINDEMWNTCFILHILMNKVFGDEIDNFINDLNIIYFQDLIDSYSGLMNRWYEYNKDTENLDYNKIKLLNIINVNSKAS